MAPFYDWGSTASRLEPLRGGGLLFTTKSPLNPQFSADLVTFIEEILNRKLHFLCSRGPLKDIVSMP